MEPTIATAKKTDEGTDVPNKQASAGEVAKDNTCETDSVWEIVAMVMAKLKVAIETNEASP